MKLIKKGKEKKKSEKVLVVIPARRGSKRLPHKNVLQIGGTPLAQRTIQIAKTAGLNGAKTKPFLKSQIVVTTNDPQVKNIASIEEVECIDRPEKLATDKASAEDVIIHAVEYVDSLFTTNEFDAICLLQVTSPLLDHKTLSKALETFIENKTLQALIAVGPDYQMCGAFYIIKKDTFLRHKSLYPKDMGIYVLSWEESQDVDTIEDFRVCQVINDHRIFFEVPLG